MVRPRSVCAHTEEDYELVGVAAFGRMVVYRCPTCNALSYGKAPLVAVDGGDRAVLMEANATEVQHA